MKIKINDNWKLISGNDNVTNYHFFDLPEDAVIANLPCYTHMYIEDHVGISWYQNDFRIDEIPSEKEIALLNFEKADFRVEVSVNREIIGVHTGVEDPFNFDVSNVLKKGKNRITVRVSKPHNKDVDGYTFDEIPHRNQRKNGLTPGGCYNESGLCGDVSLIYLPKVYIEDVYLEPYPETGKIRVEYTIVNKLEIDIDAEIIIKSGRSPEGNIRINSAIDVRLICGNNTVETIIDIDNYQLWSVENPVLYNVISQLNYDGMENTVIKRTGFRTFEVKEDGFFYLNNKRLLIKSSHTGNCMPLSMHHISLDKELLRKDFLLAKAIGFNMIRFISGSALPIQLDLCDEIGLMVYEEPVAGWCTKNGPHAKECFRHDMLSMVKRDRNHPCLTIWGLLNETPNEGEFTDLYEAARNILPDLRNLDKTRLVIFSSGRWDMHLSNGSLCNPYKTEWEFLWNGDGSADRISDTFMSKINIGKSTSGAGEGDNSKCEHGDIHFYGRIPRTVENIEYLRTVGDIHKKPVFISEVGSGSVLDTRSLVNRFEQDGRSTIYPDVKKVYKINDIFNAELKKYGFDRLYPLKSDIIFGSMLNHKKYREFDFNILRSNPYFNGISLTGLLDHSICGEGLWTLYREYKPFMADVLQVGFSPLMWCIIPEKVSLFKGEEFKVEVLISNEDRLTLGKEYPVRAAIIKDGKVIEHRDYSAVVEINNKSFVIPVFEDVFSTENYECGEYVFKLEIDGADIAGNTKTFTVHPHTSSKTSKKIYCIDVENKFRLKELGFEISEKYSSDCIVLVGYVSNNNIKEIECLLNNGAKIISAGAYKKDDKTLDLLPVERRPDVDDCGDWLYHKETIVNYESLLFEDMPAGTMDCELYGDLFTERTFDAEGKQVPDYTHALAYGMGYPNLKGYTGGFKLGTYNLKNGCLIVNLFNVLESYSPMSEKLLINLLDNA